MLFTDEMKESYLLVEKDLEELKRRFSRLDKKSFLSHPGAAIKLKRIGRVLLTEAGESDIIYARIQNKGKLERKQ